jgi:hypothetical protein
MGPVELALIIVLALLGMGAIYFVLWRAPNDDALALWLRSRGLPNDEPTATIARTELTRNRRYRRIGSLVGFLGLPVGAVLPGGFDPWVGLLAGWAVAVVVAEAVLQRHPIGGRTGASLVPRRLEQYAPRRLYMLQAIVVVATIGATGWALAIEPLPGEFENVSDALLVGCAAATALVAMAVLALQRWVVARPQPLDDPSAVAVDDAVRVDSVQALGAAAVALGGVLLSVIVRRPAQANILNPWFDLLSSALYTLSLGAAIWWSNRAFAVRRPRAVRTGAVTA